jgi:hypothetical protein
MLTRRLSLLVLLLGLAMAISVDRARPAAMPGQPARALVDSLP